MSRHPFAARLGASLALAALFAVATCQDYTGTYTDGGALTLVLDQAPNGEIAGHLVMMSGLYAVRGAVQADGSAAGGFASESNSFYRFLTVLRADGSLTLSAQAVDFSGRPLTQGPQTLQLARVSSFGLAPASPLPIRPGQVPGRPDAVVLPMAGAFTPGVRVVYYLGAASIMESRRQAVEDPTCAETRGDDCYYVPETNKWYRLRDVHPLGSVGIMQLDLLHLDESSCVARTTHYGLDPLTGLVSFLGSDGFLARGGDCGEYWIPPNRLLEAARRNVGSVEVFLGPYQLGPQSFQAVRLGTTSVSGSHQTYQASTGILVVGSDRATGSALTIDPNLILRPSTVSTHLAFTQLLSDRHIGGFTGEPLPPHALAANRLVYACSTLTSMPGVPDVEIACQQEAYLVEKAPGWALVRTVHHDPNTVTGRTFPNEGTTVLTSGSPGGLFASPALLGTLSAGQAIDFDPHTGASTFISHRDATTVTVVEQGQLHRRELTYDLATGWLVETLLERRMSPLTVVMRSRLVGVD